MAACAFTPGLWVQCSANAAHAVYGPHAVHAGAAITAKKEDHRRTPGLILGGINCAAFALVMPSKNAHVIEFFRRIKIPQKGQYALAAVDRNL